MTENAPIDNKNFLERWRSSGFFDAILVEEAILINRRIAEVAKKYDAIVDDKVAVSGGDDWHDGAFRATDAEALRLAAQSQDLHEKLRLPQVEMPSPESTAVSLGSRALVLQNRKAEYSLDIVGYSLLHSDDDAEVATIASPLGRYLMGKESGETFLFEINGRQHEMEVIHTQPNPVLLFENRDVE